MQVLTCLLVYLRIFYFTYACWRIHLKRQLKSSVQKHLKVMVEILMFLSYWVLHQYDSLSKLTSFSFSKYHLVIDKYFFFFSEYQTCFQNETYFRLEKPALNFKIYTFCTEMYMNTMYKWKVFKSNTLKKRQSILVELINISVSFAGL